MPRRRPTSPSRRRARKSAARWKSASASRSLPPRQNNPARAARRNSSHRIAARKRSTSSKACSAASLGNQRRQRRDPFRRLVQALDEPELAPARGVENVARADADLFQGFEAIGYKARADHIHLAGTGTRQFHERLLGIRLEPLRIAEARLERDAPLA